MVAVALRTEETRNRLIAAGLELFGRHGYEGVTTRQLADAAGVNQAAIPYHFGGKAGVYRAVAAHIAAVTGSRVGPVLAAARQRLEAAPGRPELAAMLVDLTQALARVAFAPEHRTAWFSFLTREQFHPSAAFDMLYEAFLGPSHALAGELIGRLTGRPPEAAETILLTHAYLGQIIGFASARATVNRRLGRTGDFGPEDVEAVVAAIGRLSRTAVASMGSGLPGGA